MDDIDFIYTPIAEVKRKLTQIYMGYVANLEGIQRRTFEAEFGGYAMDPEFFGAAIGSSTVVRSLVNVLDSDSHTPAFHRWRLRLDAKLVTPN